jgi:hypothetical protein
MGISFLHLAMHISSDFNHPKRESHRATILSDELTNRRSKFNEIYSPHPPQVRQRFPMKNFSQAFKNIVSTSGGDEHFSENPASGNYGIDLNRSV